MGDARKNSINAINSYDVSYSRIESTIPPGIV